MNSHIQLTCAAMWPLQPMQDLSLLILHTFLLTILTMYTRLPYETISASAGTVYTDYLQFFLSAAPAELASLAELSRYQAGVGKKN